VVLTGSRSRVQEAPGFVETEPVSIVGARDSVEVRVPIRIPQGLQLLDSAQQTVTVRVEVSPFTGGRDFEVIPQVLGLGEGLVAEASPPRIQVFLSGPVPDLESLDQQDIQVVLDLEGLPAGRHRIQPIVEVGRDSLQARTLPEIVDVTILPIPTPTPEVTETPKVLR
jgi:YbbR domain-containing protein